MKMSNYEFNIFQTLKENACGAEIMLRLLEEYPSKLNDGEIHTLATSIRSLVNPIAEFMQKEIIRQEEG